jgi:hypothetical protein
MRGYLLAERRMNERAVEFLKAQGTEVETSDASEAPDAYSWGWGKIPGAIVAAVTEKTVEVVRKSMPV